MIYLLVLIGFIFLGTVIWTTRKGADREVANDRLLKKLSERQDFCDELVKVCERAHNEQKARIDALKGTVDTLSGLYHNECLALQKVIKDQEFMKAHQHGMDKRIAGLKREVIVTINEASKVPGPKKEKRPPTTKSLLKRAGVTQ